MKRKIDTLVFSGGGMKGIAYIGVLRCLENIKSRFTKYNSDNLDNVGNVDNVDKNDTDNYIPDIDIKTVCGVSIGSFMSLLYIIGYSSDSLQDIIINKDLGELKDISINNFVNKYGFDSGKNIINWLEHLLENKGYSKDITLKELYLKTGIHYKVCCTNLNKYKMEIYDYIRNPNLKITKVIRMSMSIPLIFSVKKCNKDIIVDGGIINNYPINIFDNNLDKVLGIKFISKGEFKDDLNFEINTIQEYVFHTFNCYMVQKERSTTLSYKYKEHTICLRTEHVTTAVNFDLSRENKLDLIEIGYKSACNYFSNMNF